MTYNLTNASILESEKSYFFSGSLKYEQKPTVLCFENSVVFPPDMGKTDFHTGAIDEAGRIIPESTIFETFRSDWHPCVDNKKLVYRDTAIYIGWLEPIWGHILTDNLKKLWFLETEECKKLISEGAELICIRPWESKAANDFFSLIGVDLGKIKNIEQATQYKRLYIPENSIVSESDTERRLYSSLYENIILRIKNSIPITPTTGKLYFSRTKFSKKQRWKERGEESIEKVFKNLGYKIIYPEEFSVSDLLVMLGNCEAFASTEGSISHNAVFCKSGTNVTIIRKVNFINTWQLMLNEIANINVTYVDGHRSVISKGCMGPFYLCITPEIERYIGKKILHLPYYLKLSFWIYYMQNRKVTKRMMAIYQRIKQFLSIKWTRIL